MRFAVLSEWTVAMLVVLAVVWATALMGCETEVVGWDPASMRCRSWDGTKFTGPFLPDSRCVGEPTPELIQPEPQE